LFTFYLCLKTTTFNKKRILKYRPEGYSKTHLHLRSLACIQLKFYLIYYIRFSTYIRQAIPDVLTSHVLTAHNYYVQYHFFMLKNDFCAVHLQPVVYELYWLREYAVSSKQRVNYKKVLIHMIKYCLHMKCTSITYQQESTKTFIKKINK